jgi:hypothetical protein
MENAEEPMETLGQIQRMFRSILQAADSIVKSYEDVALQAFTTLQPGHIRKSHRAVWLSRFAPETVREFLMWGSNPKS